jgi:hypothetical protein
MDDHLTIREPPVSEFHWKLNPLNEHWINSISQCRIMRIGRLAADRPSVVLGIGIGWTDDGRGRCRA